MCLARLRLRHSVRSFWIHLVKRYDYDYFVYARNNWHAIGKIDARKWGACSSSVKTIKIEDFPNATLFLLHQHTKKQ